MREESLQRSLYDLSSASFSPWLIFHLVSLLDSTKIATVARSNRKTRTTQADISVIKSENYCLKAKPWMGTSFPNFPYMIWTTRDLSATKDGFRTCLGFWAPLIWYVSSRIGQSALYVQNLNINTQIIQGPLQGLLSLARPLAIRKQVSELPIRRACLQANVSCVAGGILPAAAFVWQRSCEHESRSCMGNWWRVKLNHCSQIPSRPHPGEIKMTVALWKITHLPILAAMRARF